MTGSIGLLGTRPSYEMMMGCDTLLTVGSSFPYTQFMPAFDQATAVQIDVDPTMIGMRYPYQVNLVGDAAATLRALIPLLERKTDRGWREGIEDDVARWWETMHRQAQLDADVMEPGPTSDPSSPVSLYDHGKLGSVADAQVGRLVEPDEGAHTDQETDSVAYDAGSAGGGASAEELAIHETRPPHSV